LTLSGALVAGVAISIVYVKWLIQVDPFARFRPAVAGPLDQSIGIRLEDSRFRNYEGSKLTAKGRVGRIDVRKDRHQFEFYDVSEGIAFGPRGALRFSAPRADYNSGLKLLRAAEGARIWNVDMDLKVGGFSYDERLASLRVPGRVTGRLREGQVVAEELRYAAESDSYETGPIEWEGPVELPVQEGGAGRKVSWKIKADRSFGLKDQVEEYVNAEATDGEVLVKAPRVRWDRKADVLEATGGVMYFGLDANLTCDKVTVYRKEKRAVLEGSVTMLVKPEDEERLEVVEIPPFRPAVPDEIAAERPQAPERTAEEQRKLEEEVRSTENLRKYPVSVLAARIEYWYKKGERRAEITGSPQAYQALPNGEWRRVWAPKAHYDGEKETLRLISSEGKKDTRLMTSLGDDAVATWFQVSTKKDNSGESEGFQVEGTFVVTEEDERPSRGSGAKPPPGGTPSPLRGKIGG
jgi:hypothetical protein